MKKKHRGVDKGSIAMILLSLVVLISGSLIIHSLLEAGEQPLVSVEGGSIQLFHWNESSADQTGSAESGSVITAEAAVTVQPTASLEVINPEPNTAAQCDAVFSFAGTTALETSVRQSGYDKTSGTYDFSGVLQAVNRYMAGDLAWAQMENLVIPGTQVSDTVAPDEISGMLASGGFNFVSFGFSKALDYGEEGIRSTQLSLEAAGIEHNGAYRNEDAAELAHRIMDIQGMKTALLQYTETLSSKGKKQAQSLPYAVPLLSEAESEIRKVRELGAQCVIVRVNWGTIGKTQPTKTQRETAQRLANAGADLIIGCGTRRVQDVEILNATDSSGKERRVICAYSLGTLIQASTKSGARESIILRIHVHYDAEKGLSFSDISYVPTFVWHAKENGKNLYIVIPSMDIPPEEMTNAQEKLMKQSADRIAGILEDSPVILYSDVGD